MAGNAASDRRREAGGGRGAAWERRGGGACLFRPGAQLLLPPENLFELALECRLRGRGLLLVIGFGQKPARFRHQRVFCGFCVERNEVSHLISSDAASSAERSAVISASLDWSSRFKVEIDCTSSVG